MKGNMPLHPKKAFKHICRGTVKCIEYALPFLSNVCNVLVGGSK